jgi:hypothetical protein
MRTLLFQSHPSVTPRRGVRSRRDKKAAKRLLRKLLRIQGERLVC